MMEGHRDKEGFVPLQKLKSSDSASGGNRRRSSSTSSWFKKLSNKVTGSDPDSGTRPRRKNSTGSIFSMGSQDESDGETEHFPKLRRWRSSSISTQEPNYDRNTPTSPQRRSSSEMYKEAHPNERRNVVAVPESVEEEETREASPKESKKEHVSLSDLKRRKISTRAVGFASSTFDKNPPQRIPPVTPAQGPIEFLNNGDLLLRKGSRVNSGLNPPYLQEKHAHVCQVAQRRATENAEKLHETVNHANHGISSGIQSIFGKALSPGTESDDEEPEDRGLELENVDGNVPDETQWGSNSTGDSKSDKTPASPEDIYTRCCHLREIMPIKNILRQLKGQIVPVQSIRIANTKPTLVEIEAFSDFLTAVPVVTLGLDNHILSDEMLRLIFVGISRSRDLVRLSLRNTDLSQLGWQYLCSFLATCRKSLLILDLSCSNPTEVAHRVPSFERSDADWPLFNEALTAMGSLEELNLGGTKIPMHHLKMLLHNGFNLGRGLSLAYNDLKHDDFVGVVEWANRPESRLVKIDLSGNDLSSTVDWTLVQNFITNGRIQNLILRNAKLNKDHVISFEKGITPAEAVNCSLRVFDVSGNPELFPKIIDRLSSVLHRFPDLSEFKVESCNLNNDNIISLCETLSHCHKLVHVSFNGNCYLNETSTTALCVAVHLSQSICTVEADVPEKYGTLRKQLADYCLQNLERTAGSLDSGSANTSDHELHSDIKGFHEELRSVAAVINDKPEEAVHSSDEIVSRIDQLRTRIKGRIQSLLIKRRSGPLNVGDREATIRLFFFSTTLDRLRREVSGTPNDTGNAEETVSSMDVAEERPSLARQESLLSLKKLEREEAASHRKYTDLLNNLADDKKLSKAVDNLNINDLGKIIGE